MPKSVFPSIFSVSEQTPAAVCYAEISAAQPTFYLLHQIGGAYGRRSRPEYVHMILAGAALFDPNIQTEACLPDQLPRSMGNLALQHVVPIFRHPYQVILDLVNRVRPASISARVLSGEARSLCRNSLPRRYVLKRLV